MELSTVTAGALVATQGWTLLNLGALVPIALVGGALLWLAAKQRAAGRAL